MGYLVEKLYYQRKNELNARERVSVNYSLTNNGRKCDEGLIECLDSCNVVETITMLRCYDTSDTMTGDILKKAFLKLRATWKEFNVLDSAEFIAIYMKWNYLDGEVEDVMQKSYDLLKKNVNATCLEKIWQLLPDRLN